MNYEEAISEIQGKETFNLFVLLTFSVMACISAMDINSIVFIGFTPPFTCTDSVFNQTNLTWIKYGCQAIIKTDNRTNQIINCNNWKFDKTVMANTIATEFNLICNRESFVTIMNTLFFVGMVFGNFIGIIGDKVGRIKMIKLGVFWEVIINITLPFLNNIWLIILFRFLSGFSTGKIYQGICYLTEIISFKKRSLYTNNYWILYVFGYMLIPGIAFGTRDWRLTRHLMNIPMLFYLFYFWLPESPRWLGISGNDSQAKDSLFKIAKLNRKKITKNQFESLIIEKEPLGNFSDIFRPKCMRLKALILIFVHGTISLSYFGLSINESFISKNIFLNVFIQAILELFTGPAAWILSTKLNRKIALTMNFTTCSICLLLNNVFNYDNLIVMILKSIFGSIGKFALTTAYCIIDMYLNEVFPTPIRNMSIFIILGIASIFTVFAPTVNEFDKYLPYFSSTCYSIFCLSSGILIYFYLPETKGCPLPQTLKEGIALRKGNEKNYCDMILKNDKESKLNSI